MMDAILEDLKNCKDLVFEDRVSVDFHPVLNRMVLVTSARLAPEHPNSTEKVNEEKNYRLRYDKEEQSAKAAELIKGILKDVVNNRADVDLDPDRTIKERGASFVFSLVKDRPIRPNEAIGRITKKHDVRKTSVELFI